MSKIRVVLIEDHELTRLNIRIALQQSNAAEVVGEAANATIGLKLLQDIKPDVAIVDIGLPDMDGIELTQRFKATLKQQSPSETKVLILTMQSQQNLVLAAFAAGADSYCMKDTSSERLLEALRVTAEGYAWIDPAIARIVLQQSLKGQQQQTSLANPKGETVSIKADNSECSQILEAYPLTSRELEILQLIVQGCSNAAIAQQLYITVGTVKTHIRNILHKLCVDDRTQAAIQALRCGLVS